MGNFVRDRVAKVFREVFFTGEERERKLDQLPSGVRCPCRSRHACRHLETNGKKFRGELRVLLAQFLPHLVRFPHEFPSRLHARIVPDWRLQGNQFT